MKPEEFQRLQGVERRDAWTKMTEAERDAWRASRRNIPPPTAAKPIPPILKAGIEWEIRILGVSLSVKKIGLIVCLILLGMIVNVLITLIILGFTLIIILLVNLSSRTFGGPPPRIVSEYEAPNNARSNNEELEAQSQYQNPPDKDEWEGSFGNVVDPHPMKARLRLTYVDGAGKQTQRTVEVREFGKLGPNTILIGHCLLRNATRIFRADRVQHCVDEKTWEVVHDIQSYLKKTYEESSERTIEDLLEGEYDTLRILLYVGKADGQLRAAERAVILETC